VIPADVLQVVIATLTGLLSSTGFLLSLFVGFCFFAGLAKLRGRDRSAMVVRSLAERVDGQAKYLSPDAPAGPADQLRTPELLEQSGRSQ
jgi:hypothetical protein